MFTSDASKSSIFTMMDEYSPKLPAGMPRELLPKDLCERDLIKLVKCVAIIGSGETCEHRYESFDVCRRIRDGQIYQNIAEWEKEKFKGMSQSDKTAYLADLQKKSSELKMQKDKILIRQANELKIWRYNSDLAQLGWRMKYLQAISSSPN